MANRQQGYGLTKELGAKMDAKYDPAAESEVVSWICAVTNAPRPQSGRDNIHAWLKDGHVLCKLINKLVGRDVCKPNQTAHVKLAAMRKNKEMENIGMFLREVEKYGIRATDSFQTVDLFENQNMAQVLTTLFKLGGVARDKNFNGPVIGVKQAVKNEREFDEQKLREGRNIIGLQMGTNQVASQANMTPYGLGRQLTPQTK